MSGADPSSSSCASCGVLLGPSLLVCPACHALVHTAALQAIAADATEASRDGDVSRELAAWRSALDLLPPSSTQFATIRERIEQAIPDFLEPMAIRDRRAVAFEHAVRIEVVRIAERQDPRVGDIEAEPIEGSGRVLYSLRRRGSEASPAAPAEVVAAAID